MDIVVENCRQRLVKICCIFEQSYFWQGLRYYETHVDIAYLRNRLGLGLGLGLSSGVRVSVMVMVRAVF